ncbi:related to pantothenate kinase [Melanopsichium pennsylvanicum]|uniref:Related to pantothenate kinase n=2 Tax=Melanopsichium pennsylvanicum TaxID=63383 RepID=A0AAJ5C8J2_9BASI|nr:related to pantothenate kinase [Melanopsichium pennsylvanicum 4]SNX88036.1 related to pantothenate kinase [Melanopsichium pennsylvanicum]
MNTNQSFPAPPVEIFVDTRGAKIMEDGASSPDQRDSRDIYLPNHIEAVSHIAVDVGGSLAKVVYFTRSRNESLPSFPAIASPVQNTSPLPNVAATSPTLNTLSPQASTSNFRSQQTSANGTIPSGFRTPPSVEHPIASGTLTPTAILGSPQVASASAIHSNLLRRRSLPAALPGGRLNFIKFETNDIDNCIRFLRELIERSASVNGVSIEDMRKGVKLMATGGGAHLMYDLFEQQLGIEVHKEDEMGCLITGLNFITLIPDEVFWYSDELVAALHSPLPQNPEARADAQALRSSVQLQHPLPRPSPHPPLYAPVFDSHPSPKLPCLLVNIGSGVSIIKVDDFGKFERVSGTSLGGGTLWGLLSLLTEAESFDEMLELSEQGDNANVDMLVGDIYGSVGLNQLGLKSSTIASSFGKVFRKDPHSPAPRNVEERRKKFRSEDICKSLLYAISNNIGQIAYMNAEKYNLDRIYFGGCFIRGHQATISTLSYAIRFWSKGTKRAFFLRHEGYLGAIGAWIKHVSQDPTSFANNNARAAAQAMTASFAGPAAAGRSTPSVPSGLGRSISPVSSSDEPLDWAQIQAASLQPYVLNGDGLPEAVTPDSSAVLPNPRLTRLQQEDPSKTPTQECTHQEKPLGSQSRSPPQSDLDFLNGVMSQQRVQQQRPRQPAGVQQANGTSHNESDEGNHEPAAEKDEAAQLNEILASLNSLKIPSRNGDDPAAAQQTERDEILSLLANLEQTEEVVGGLEGKLDNLLSSLDTLIANQQAQELAQQAVNRAG